MNKRQLKKRVKRAKINKERGLILSLEDRHYIRNYGKCYHTEKETALQIINSLQGALEVVDANEV